MLTKIILIIFLAYLVNKVLVLPFKREFSKFFQNTNKEKAADPENTGGGSGSKPLVPEEEIEDAEFHEIKD